MTLFVLSSCAEKDYYDVNYMQVQAQANFPVPMEKVDPTHTWETLTLVKAIVTIPDNATDTLWVYAGNPYGATPGALLAKRAVVPGRNEFAFDKPQTTTKFIYLLTRDAKGHATAVADTVRSDGTLQYDFTATRATRSRADLLPTTRTAVADYGWTPAEISATDATLFPTEAPAGAVTLPGLYDYNNFVVEGGNYLVTSVATSINCSNPANFYVQGDVTLSNIYFGGTAEGRIVLLPGARLTMGGLPLGINTSLVICPGGMLNCGLGTIQFSNSCKNIYNAGTIICGKLLSSTQREFYNLGTIAASVEASNLTDLYFYNMAGASFSTPTLDINNGSKYINAGTVTVSGSLSTKNNNSLFANRSVAEAGSFSTEGSSRFYNEDTGSVTVSGHSLVNSNNCTWDNSGSFTTKTMTFNAGSENWYNRCSLYVLDLLTIELSGGYLYVDGGGYVECANLYMNNAKVVMGSNAYFNVLKRATFNYHGYNPWWTQGHQGFFGVGTDPALIRIKEAVKANEGTFPCINFFDNLQVTTQGFAFPQQKDEYNINYHLDGGATAIPYTGGTVDVESSSCAQVHNPGGDDGGDVSGDDGGDDAGDEIPSTPQAYTYFFEDMTEFAGDYDFNDCVISVTTPVDGTMTVTIWAAGCTKTLDLCLKVTAGNRNNTRVLISDVGRAFITPSGEHSDGWIVNTETSSMSENEIYCHPVTIVVDDLPSDFNLTEHGDFFITDNTGQVHIPAFTEGFVPGQVPYALRVPGEWSWPIEYIPVTSVYFGFDKWAQDATQETNWYEHGFAKDYVFDKSLLP